MRSGPGREGRGRGCVRLGACVRGITVDRPTVQRHPGQRDRFNKRQATRDGLGRTKFSAKTPGQNLMGHICDDDGNDDDVDDAR